MYAIIETGGHQLKVTPGGFATVPGTVAELGTKVTPGGFVMIDGTPGAKGDQLSIDRVLLVEKDGGEVLAGSPFVANARVVAVVEGEARGPKIRVFKKKRRKGQRRTKGHRAVYTRVRITEIVA